MADYSIPNLTTAVVGFASTASFQVQSTSSFTIEPSNGTVSIGNIDLSADITETIPGWLTGRRPSQGQVFPRGVYNK
jgi:hypothetical protein